jgi:hypothetical protein
MLIIILLLLCNRAVDTRQHDQRILAIANLRRRSKRRHRILVARQVDLHGLGNLIST